MVVYWQYCWTTLITSVIMLGSKYVSYRADNTTPRQKMLHVIVIYRRAWERRDTIDFRGQQKCITADKMMTTTKDAWCDSFHLPQPMSKLDFLRFLHSLSTNTDIQTFYCQLSCQEPLVKGNDPPLVLSLKFDWKTSCPQTTIVL